MPISPGEFAQASAQAALALARSRGSDPLFEVVRRAKEFLRCDAVLFAEKSDALTLSIRLADGANSMLLSVSHPAIVESALETFECVTHPDYSAVPAADPLVVSWGARGVAILPASQDGDSGSALVLLWKAVIEFPRDAGEAFAPLWALIQALFPHRKTQTALSETRERLTAILETIPDAVVFIDDDGERGWLNGPAARLLELTGGEASPEQIAAGMRKLRRETRDSPEMRRIGIEIARNASADVRDWRWELENPRQVLSVTSRPTRIGGVSGRVWVFRDITSLTTAEEELRSQEERWQLALAGTNEGIWDWNALTGEVFYSPRWKQMLGYADDELPNDARLWETMVHPEDLGWVQKALQEHLDRVTPFYVAEYRIRCKDGSWKWVLAHGRAVWDENGRPLRLVGAHTDMTQRRLDDELLREAKQAADDANAAKSSFLARMSHEIRTPMNAILGLSDLLWDTQLDTTQRDYVRVFRNNAQRLLHLINDILDLSKVEAGALELEIAPFIPGEIVDNVRDLLTSQAERRNLSLTFDVAPEAREVFLGDGNRLEQILVNLIGNAVKFTAHGGVAVRVGIHPTSPQPGRFLFSVADTGPGIAKEDVQSIFEPFVQADSSTTRKHRGTGLGLTITKKFIELMDGSIWVESRLGAGSTFFFTVLLKPSVAAPAEERAKAAPAGNAVTGKYRSARILVAEDSEDNQFLIRAYLNELPWELDFASDGGVALRKALSSKYDLILMDVQMPEMDGYEVTRKIREMEKASTLPAVPIIALTAHANQAEAAKARACGCTGYLSKPVAKRALIIEIETWLPSNATQQEEFHPDDGVPAIVRAMAPEYLKNRKSEPDEILAHLAAGNFDPIVSLGHNMKGSGASFGLPAITEVGAKIEKAARMRDRPEIESLVEELRAVIAEGEKTFPLLH